MMGWTLEVLKRNVAAKLVGIERLLPSDYALTLVARHRTNNDAHIVVTVEDDMREAVAAIEKLYPMDPH